MNDSSPSDVSGQQNLDLRSWPSCVEPFIYGEVLVMLCLPDVQIYAVLAALNSINYNTLFMPGRFVLRMDKLLLLCVAGFNWK